MYIYDTDGRKFLDFSSQLIAVNIGHGHPKVAEAVARQMSEVSYVYPGMVTKVRGEVGRNSQRSLPEALTELFLLSEEPKQLRMQLSSQEFIPDVIK